MALSNTAKAKILEYIQSGDCPTHMYPVYRWWLQRRDEQICPKPIPTIWYLLAGRGAGKTWSAANHIYEFCVQLPWVAENDEVYVALIGSTFDDVKNTMVEGKSGLLKVIPEENLVAWNRTVGELKFFIQEDGERRLVICNTFTSERPEKLRGPNTHVAWIDEPGKFKDAWVDPTKVGTTWSNMILGLRLGTSPHVIVTGTPNKSRLIKYLDQHPGMRKSSMTTHDNMKNLPSSYLQELEQLGVGSIAWRQEVLGEIVTDNPDALFNSDKIDDNRWGLGEDELPLPVNFEEYIDRDEPPFIKVLGYDPATSAAADADECGIILVGYTPEVKQATAESGGRPVVIKPTHAYLLKDLSGHFTPAEQVQLVIQTVLNEKVSDLVYEQNQGVQFVMSALEQALKDNLLEYRMREKSQRAKKTEYGAVKAWEVTGVDRDGEPVRFTIYSVHAVSGKTLRAEMVSGRYMSNQIHHPDPRTLPMCEIRTCRAHLEDQMYTWDPKGSKHSPDRLDALVYCLLHIFSGNKLTKSKMTIARPPAPTQATSEHGAAKHLKKSIAGIYSMDISGSETSTAERGLLSHIIDRGRDLEGDYFRNQR